MPTERTPTTLTPDGTLETRGDSYVMRFERRLRHPLRRVWAALTEPRHIVEWLAAAELDLAPGGRIRLEWLNAEPGEFVATGTITRLDPPRLIEYDTDHHGRLTWALQPEGDGCVLSLTCTIPTDAAEATRQLAGWHVHLDLLAAALDGTPRDWSRWTDDEWKIVHARYQERYSR
jgi:uncharacterized protein YndB with AHSA1/START domain